ncbi:PLP-dependent aminotransferase family protein [Dactylosporangium sp. CA-152071]|uniref:MocR-like pyridoxine biosynthesis transcription factor PdxR n=1 Tax=Dactylosporangium sp. CA-152071 TaxID=3239933 RepID=UPI003D8C7EFF
MYLPTHGRGHTRTRPRGQCRARSAARLRGRWGRIAKAAQLGESSCHRHSLQFVPTRSRWPDVTVDDGLHGRSKRGAFDPTKLGVLVELFIDPDDARSVTVQLYEQVRDAILDGRLTPGDQLLPTRSVAAELGLARSTVTDAYGRLTGEGYVEGRAGGGSIVAGGLGPCTGSPSPGALVPTRRAESLRPFDPEPETEARFDLRTGRVDLNLFPAAAWRRSLLAGLRQPPAQYGDPAGTTDLRTALSHWLATSRGITVHPAQIVVTSGAAHAVDLVARVLLEPGDVVGMEEPGYPPVHSLLRAQGAEVVGVPVDEHGIVVDAIPPAARLIYVSPSHQYPLGVVLDRRRRLELLRWASRTGAAIIEDDYDSEFRHTSRPLEPLHRLDRDGRVIYVGTFSKTLTPALRIGFLTAPSTLIQAITTTRQAVDWSPPETTQHAMTHFINNGHLGRHLRRARTVYTQRYTRIHQQLRQHLPTGYQPVQAHAGLHLAVRGPDTPADADLFPRAAAIGLLISSLRRTYHHTPNPTAGFLIGFGALPTPMVTAAIDALTTTLETRRQPPRQRNRHR